jgi:purine-binding chemotaxis protein CheW
MSETATMQANAASADDSQALREHAGKYLTFSLGKETYGIEILKVQEIIEMVDVTHVPRTPEFVKGVINLRGRVIPVVDLRLKFGMEKKEVSRQTCIVVVYVQSGDSRLTMGMMVDAVSEVLDIAGDSVAPAPDFGSQVDTEFLLGMARSEGAVRMLLDIDKVLSTRELSIVKSASDKA